MVIGRRSLLLAGVAVPVAARAQCVTDTPGVDACLGGVRITQPPGVTLDLSFLGPTLDARITFTRASTATYFDSSGVMQTAASGAPRFDYDPVTHAARGLLIEEARTNLMWPSIPTGTNWFPTNATTAAAQGIAPDGTNTFVRIIETAANTNHIQLNNASLITATAGQPYTLSTYVQMASGVRYFQLVVDDNVANGAMATFDLSAGTISGPMANLGSGVGLAASITPVGGGIYRCVLSSNAFATTIRLGLALSNIPNPGRFPVYLGSTSNSLLAWGVQFEAGAFPTSYIPTTAAAVTRAVDVATMPTAAWFNGPAGSLAVEAYAPLPGANAVINAAWASLDDGTVNNVLELRSQLAASDFRVLSFAGGVNSGASVATAAMTANIIFKGAATYNTAPVGVFVALNGTAPGGNTISAVPSGITRLVIGPSRGNPPSSAVRRIRYWPRVLSNAEMQSVTR